jgi:hypothetical protein
VRATTTAGIASVVTLMAALFVLLFGVLATSGTYGSRLAWLLVALPGLALTMLLASLSLGRRSLGGLSLGGRSLGGRSLGRHRRARPFLYVASGDRHDQAGRGVFLVAASLFGLPLAFAAMLLVADTVFFVAHGLSLLL